MLIQQEYFSCWDFGLVEGGCLYDVRGATSISWVMIKENRANRMKYQHERLDKEAVI